jgi:hypothetical protein
LTPVVFAGELFSIPGASTLKAGGNAGFFWHLITF